MLKLSSTTRARTITGSAQSLLLLGPEDDAPPGAFLCTRSDKDRYNRLLSKMQRFRGATYVQDGAITPAALDCEGRHRLEIDFQSWHVLSVNENDDICGCSRYSKQRTSVDFSNLAVGRSAMARSDNWGAKLKSAVERERRTAAEQQTSFVEMGGWAIAEQLRGTMEALRIALATYALARKLGGGIGVTTATVRHCSASILRKIGGSPLREGSIELPRYYDPEYDCEMEIIRFHSATPNPKFLPWIEQIETEMSAVEVLTPRSNVVPVISLPAELGANWESAFA